MCDCEAFCARATLKVGYTQRVVFLVVASSFDKVTVIKA